MKLIVDNGNYDFKNIGDIAMLQASVDRFARFLPGWSIDVVTRSPSALGTHCPRGNPVWWEGSYSYSGWKLLGGLHRVGNASVRRWLRAAEQGLRNAAPTQVASLLAVRFKGAGFPAASVREFIDAVLGADAIVSTGGGYITDCFSKHAHHALGTLRFAQAAGIPTAMFGQGLGPIDDPVLLDAARDCMRRLEFLGLREGRAGTRLAESIGVPSDRVVVTGDDAIELAYIERPARLGEALGVNLRVASYSGVSKDFASEVLRRLGAVAKDLGADALPIPISCYNAEVDAKQVIEHIDIDAAEQERVACIHTPSDAARQAGRCRVVVTGSYHGGVFALSQGVSVVGLAANQYYVDKFLGLQAQFGEGCTAVVLDGDAGIDRMCDAVHEAWKQAPVVREQLLRRASEQAEASRTSYERWCASLVKRFGSGNATPTDSGIGRGAAAAGARS